MKTLKPRTLALGEKLRSGPTPPGATEAPVKTPMPSEIPLRSGNRA